MQSGISELRDAFTAFLSSPSSHFCLPITIQNEQLIPLSPISFASDTNRTANNQQFFASLPSLKEVLQPKTPLYLLLRRFPHEDPAESQLIALTYIPSDSPVRAKTLFASTRATVVRELGSEKFSSNVFATDEDEVLSEGVWREREADMNAARGGSGNGTGGEADDAEQRRQDAMGEQEKELDALRRAEDEARNMSFRRDIGIGGTVGGDKPADIKGVMFPVGDGVKEALQKLDSNEGGAVLLSIVGYTFANLTGKGIDIPTETLTLVSTESNVAPGSLSSLIPDSKPQYTFYRYPNSSALVFIYTCPPTSAIKERMLYASCRRGILSVAAAQGLTVSHKRLPRTILLKRDWRKKSIHRRMKVLSEVLQDQEDQGGDRQTPRALKAVERVADPLASADNAFVLVVSKGAFVADTNEGGGADVGVADGAFAVAFVAEPADGDAGLFAAHDEIGVVAGHGGGLIPLVLGPGLKLLYGEELRWLLNVRMVVVVVKPLFAFWI
ncbi:Twinfilin-1 [Emydomyces testavorans]|uniref:Twinfilin-1 n=1 Tax=Emydomyces testavorans TaxID=2070801 RepID=A0AAF0DLS5_9EURO|nr:Twinfilin-1 [Emydomyces testavorans]